MMIFASSILEVHAQSYVTYNHDEAKMNQITVQGDRNRWPDSCILL